METLSGSAMPFPREPPIYEEVSMQQQTALFADSLKDMKNLRKQLYSAAEYFELSYSNDDQKDVVVNTLKEYVIKALVNTVDHLGSMTCKVNDVLDEKTDEVCRTELRVSCIEQRLRSCQQYIDHEGLSQQSSQINTPKYHKRYILPVGEALRGLDAEDDWSQFRNAVQATIAESDFSFSKAASKRDLEPEKQSQFPLLRTASLARRRTTPKTSRSTTPNSSRPTTPNTRRLYPSEPQKSASMRLHSDREIRRDSDQYPGKSKRLLKALLSRRKSKKDETLYTYIDEY